MSLSNLYKSQICIAIHKSSTINCTIFLTLQVGVGGMVTKVTY